MKHVILDTDIGGDPDDAYALALGMNSPEIKIDLIVTSDEHKGHRKSFAEEFVRGKIPVVQGADLGNDRLCVVCSAAKESEQRPDYLEAIKRAVQKNDITYYVCISPQTNLARFIDSAPELREKLRIIIMGGNAKGQRAEHNVRFDIDAAKKVISSGIKQKWVTSDVTVDERMRITKDSEIFKKLQKSTKPECKMIVKNEELFWKKLYPSNFLHDPVTLSSIFSNTVLFKKCKAIIDDEGFLVPDEEGYEIETSTKVNVSDFLELLNRIFQ